MLVSHFLYLLAALKPVSNHYRLKASNDLRAFCASSTTGLNIQVLCGSSSFLDMMMFLCNLFIPQVHVDWAGSQEPTFVCVSTRTKIIYPLSVPPHSNALFFALVALPGISTWPERGIRACKGQGQRLPTYRGCCSTALCGLGLGSTTTPWKAMVGLSEYGVTLKTWWNWG